MKRKTIFWLMTLALVSVPVLSIAQEGPGPGDDDELEMMEDGEEGMRPGLGPDAMPGRARMEAAGQRGMGQERMAMRKKALAGKGKTGGFFPEEEVLAVIKKHDPAFAGKVGDLKETAPAKYKMVIQMSGRLFGAARMSQDETLEKDAVRALALEFESKELSLKYNKVPDGEKKAVSSKLKGVLSELFDLRSKGQEARVKYMEGEIGRLKKNLEKRKVNKGKIVEQRLEQLTGEGYGW